MPTKCTITGTVVSPDGSPIALAQIEFGSAKVRPMTPLTIAPESAAATTDEAGALTVELYPGEYSVRAMKTGRQRYPTFSITVPEAASAVLADIIDLPPPVSLDAAGQAVLAAQHLRDEAAGFASDAEVAEFEAGEASGQAIDAAGVALGAAGVATGKAGEAADSAAVALAAKNAVDLGALDEAKAQTEADRLAAAASAAAAGTAAGTATGAATTAGMAMTAAETARDASIVNAQTYATEALGRAAVADGATFDVQGSGDVASYRYRRTTSSTSVLIATFPSVAGVQRAFLPQGSEILWRTTAAIPVGWYDTKQRITLGASSRAVLSNVFDPTLDDIVSELTDPTLPFNLNRTVVLLTDPAIPARCDGTKWVNVATGAEITPWWLPPLAALHVDLENGRFYWGGSVRALSDLTNVSGEAYTLNAAMPLSGGGATIAYDYISANPLAPPTGTLLWIGAASGNIQHRIEWQSDGGARSHRFYSTQWEVGGQYWNIDLCSKLAEGVGYPGTGRHRVVVELEVGATAIQQADNGVRRSSTLPRVVASLPDFARFGFNVGRNWGDGTPQIPATNQSLKRVTIYPRVLSADHIKAIGRTGKNHPIHILGDSFATLYRPQHPLGVLIQEDGYVGMSSDGVGSTTMTQMAARYAASDPKWWGSTLVWCDFGISADAASMIAAIEDARSRMTHDRWLYMEPAPQHVLGTPLSDAWLATVAEMKAYCGNRFVETRLPAFAAGNGSAEDNAEIAKGLYPLSLKTSLTDFHPSPAGDQFIAHLIWLGLLARGWL